MNDILYSSATIHSTAAVAQHYLGLNYGEDYFD